MNSPWTNIRCMLLSIWLNIHYGNVNILDWCWPTQKFNLKNLNRLICRKNPKKENTTKTQHFLNRKIKKIYICISVNNSCFLKILRHSIVDWNLQSIPASCCSLPLRWPQRLQIVSSIIFWSHDSYPYAAYKQRATRTQILCIVNNCSDQAHLLCSNIVNDMLSWCMLFSFPTGCWFGKTQNLFYMTKQPMVWPHRSPD